MCKTKKKGLYSKDCNIIKSKNPTSFFPAVSDKFLGDSPPAWLGAQQFQLGHDGQVIADCGPQLIKQEAKALDDRSTHLLVGAALLLVRLRCESRQKYKFVINLGFMV